MRTLIVDDQESNIKVLEKQLTRFGECDHAVSGKRALEKAAGAMAEGRRFDLICLDIMMPEMDGHAVLVELNKLDDRQGLSGSDRTRIVMVSGASPKDHLFKAFREECDAFIRKPIDRKELLNQIHELGLVDADTMLGVLLET